MTKINNNDQKVRLKNTPSLKVENLSSLPKDK